MEKKGEGHGHQGLGEELEGALEEKGPGVLNHSVGGLSLPELSGVGERIDIWGGGREEWGIATSGRQVSGTVQAAVTFPAKEKEGSGGQEGLPRVPWGRGKGS